MIAILLASTAPCKGPRSAPRSFLGVRLSGMQNEDEVHIHLSSGKTLIGRGEDSTLPLPVGESFVSAEHVAASGSPVTVEIV